MDDTTAPSPAELRISGRTSAADSHARIKHENRPDRENALTTYILGQIEDWLSAQNYRELDALLGALTPGDLPAEALLGIVALTRFKADSLANRARFLALAEAHLISQHGEDKAAQWLRTRR